ncbi:tRNA uridine-5-carboxymethylaminomethyl(34) synthesis GTPase MnmE, partial [Shewanella sp. C31]|nr:tRNA uridine-5-carboxymethylaminomethyl(34) synthesis GTPase MnmE [Shewanella electrica]
MAAGARLAGPGEFTFRAYMNGKLDLAQAEAVLALVQAEGELARRQALRALEGAFSRRIAALEEGLL